MKSVRILYKELGQYDALVEFEEVCVRYFDKSIKDNATDKLVKTANELGIYLNDMPFSDYRNRISKSYIIYPYACFERFLENFRHEVYLLTKGFIYNKKDRETPFDATLRSFKTLKIDVGLTFQKDLYDYYRLIRNSVAHHSQDDIKEIKQIYERLDKEAIQSAYPNLQEPSSFEDINFNDFVTATANVKDIADMMCKAVEAMIDKDCVIQNINKIIPTIHKLKRWKESRQNTFIKNAWHSTFGTILSDDNVTYLRERIGLSNNG